MPDAVAVLKHQLAALRPGGLLLALDFDLGSARAEPAVPLADAAMAWVNAAFRGAGANPTIGTTLALLRAQAGLADVQGFGIQGYLGPDDPRGPALLSGVVRTLAPRSSLPAWPRRSSSVSTRSCSASPPRCKRHARWCCHRRWPAPGGVGADPVFRSTVIEGAAS